MTFAKTFGQRHVLRFLSSHIDLSGCRITAASPAGLRVTDGVHQLCLKSVDGCIQRGDNPTQCSAGSSLKSTGAQRAEPL